MSACIECFFYSGFEGRWLQIAVDREHPNFACEKCRCSPYSPGPVKDEEVLGFLLVDPTHYDDISRTVTPDAFKELLNRDLSMIRSQYASAEDVEGTRAKLVERGQRKTPPEVRLVNEVCVISAADLRKAEIGGQRIFAVYDTALSENNAHASIFTTEAQIKGNKVSRKRLRERCHSLMSRTVVTFVDFCEQLRN
jgi:hypothetical protein